MRKLVALVMLALFWASPLFAAGNRYALEVAGLACPFCAYGIEKRLSALEGVEQVEIDITHGRAIVTMREGATLSETAARRAVEEAGFTLDKFQSMPGGQ